jgi:Lrp/AsnC family leucine-responsive transcriptional regulator
MVALRSLTAWEANAAAAGQGRKEISASAGPRAPLLEALQTDADRPNVELARLIALSPAATLHRVRRLKASGLIRSVVAKVDAPTAGFPLLVYVAVILQRHGDTAQRRFAEAIRAMPEVIAGDWVTGETDAMLLVVAREVAQLQRVLVRLSTHGGAARVTTLLRLEELKPSSPLPLEQMA